MDTKEMDTREMDTKEMDTKEMDTKEMDTREMDTKEMDTKEMDSKEMDTELSSSDSKAGEDPEDPVLLGLDPTDTRNIILIPCSIHIKTDGMGVRVGEGGGTWCPVDGTSLVQASHYSSVSCLSWLIGCMMFTGPDPVLQVMDIMLFTGLIPVLQVMDIMMFTGPDPALQVMDIMIFTGPDTVLQVLDIMMFTGPDTVLQVMDIMMFTGPDPVSQVMDIMLFTGPDLVLQVMDVMFTGPDPVLQVMDIMCMNVKLHKSFNQSTCQWFSFVTEIFVCYFKEDDRREQIDVYALDHVRPDDWTLANNEASALEKGLLERSLSLLESWP